MHASVGREVQAILLRNPWAALVLPAHAYEGGGAELRDLRQAFVGGHQIGR
jgi:hypothetical protein